MHTLWYNKNGFAVKNKHFEDIYELSGERDRRPRGRARVSVRVLMGDEGWMRPQTERPS